MKFICVIKSTSLDEFFKLQQEKCLKLSKQIKSLLNKNGFDIPVRKKNVKTIMIEVYSNPDKKEAVIALLQNNFDVQEPKYSVDACSIDGIEIYIV